MERGPTERGQRQSATDYFSKTRQIGRHTIYFLCAADGHTEPEITSSKIRSDPYLEHRSLRPSRKPGSGATIPMLPATGSELLPQPELRSFASKS